VTNLRSIPASPAAPASVREVIAWAVDDWLERTAPTEETGSVWSSVDIAEHVVQHLEQSGYRIAAPAGPVTP
jgi:hypothetical protein